MGKEITRIKSGNASDPWPYSVECHGQEYPEPEITAARAALGISSTDLIIGTEASLHSNASSPPYGTIAAKSKDDLQKLCEYLLSRGWTIRQDHLWTARRHSQSWGPKSG